jgi:hypothetical protein
MFSRIGMAGLALCAVLLSGCFGSSDDKSSEASTEKASIQMHSPQDDATSKDNQDANSGK